MAKKEKKSRNSGDECALEMTPMIDVVFQLLIFFIVTLKQDDILSALEALRPAPDTSISKPDPNEPITIQITKNPGKKAADPAVFIFNGKYMTEKMLEGTLKNIAKTSKDAMIMIKCTNDSPHGGLVRVLDLVSKAGLRQVSVFSM